MMAVDPEPNDPASASSSPLVRPTLARPTLARPTLARPPPASASAEAGALRRFFREPLLHFVLVGALLFAVDAARGGSSDGRRIEMGTDVRTALYEQWTVTRGRPPTPEELAQEIARWKNDEVLYREGLLRGLDRDDPRVRERIAAKMGLVLQGQVMVPPPTEEELARWYADHLPKWSKQDLYDFTHVFVSGHGDAARARAHRVLADLTAGADPAGMGDTFQGGRRYRKRKLDDLATAFGDEFIEGLDESTEGEWALRRSRFGWHAVRLDRRIAGESPELEVVRNDVLKDWEEARRAEGVRSAMEALRSRWEIVEVP